MAVEVKSIKKIASLGKRELRITDMKGEEKYDIREWDGESYKDGVRFTLDELQLFCSQAKLDDFTKVNETKSFGKQGNEVLMYVQNNGRTYSRVICDTTELDVLVSIYTECVEKGVDIKDWVSTITELPTLVDEESSKPKAKEEKKSKSNIIPFTPRKEKPELEEKLVTDGNATYEECEEKLNKEMETYLDPDSQYVLTGLKELCKVDADFRNNVMREDKTFLGVFEYMMSMAQKGYADKIGRGYSIDRDTGLGMAIDYYNTKPEPPKPKATPKKETKKTETKKAPAKRGRKKKGA